MISLEYGRSQVFACFRGETSMSWGLVENRETRTNYSRDQT